MNKKIVIALLLPLALAGCGAKAGDKKEASAPKEKGLPLDDMGKLPSNAQKSANAEIMRMRKVSGRWELQPGILPDKTQWLVLDISNDKKFTFDVRGKSPDAKLDAVYVEIQGAFVWNKDNLIEAKGNGAKPPVAALSNWVGSFPDAGKISIRGTDGKSYVLTYRGL